MIVFRSGNRCLTDVPPLTLKGVTVQRVYQFKYLGHLLTDRLTDDVDMERERRALSVRAKMLAAKMLAILIASAHCIFIGLLLHSTVIPPSTVLCGSDIPRKPTMLCVSNTTTRSECCWGGHASAALQKCLPRHALTVSTRCGVRNLPLFFADCVAAPIAFCAR